MKAVLSASERLAALKALPKEILPTTLKTEINLPNIKEIKVHYRPLCKNIGPTMQFLRKYGPAIRFYNPQLQLIRLKDNEGPLSLHFGVVTRYQQQPIILKAEKIKGVDNMLKELKRIDAEVPSPQSES